jgi:hypothetical protein
MYEQLIENKNDRRGGFFCAAPVHKKSVRVIESFFGAEAAAMLSSAGNNHPICGLQFAL